MTDENNLQHGNAVRDPQVAERAEMQGTVAPMERSVESPAEPPIGNGGVSESSPLGAFRRARLNPAVDTQAQSIPSLRPRGESSSSVPPATQRRR